MDELDQRVALALRPVRDVLAAVLGEFDRSNPGVIDRIEAVLDNPNRELQTRSPEEEKIYQSTLRLLHQARDWRRLEI